MPRAPGHKPNNPLTHAPGSRRRGLRDALALAGGFVLPLAFAPFGVFPLAVLAPALLFALWQDESPGRAAWRGFLFGLGMFGLGVSWVYVSMHNYGNMPAPLAAFATLLFVMGLSLYPALFGWLQARLTAVAERRQASAMRLHTILVLPALWVLFEWLRGWFLSGFPWLDLGYSQAGVPLSGFAPWLGVYGVGYACALSAALLLQGLREPRWAPLFLPALAAIWVLGWYAGQAVWVQPSGGPLRVALIQGNVPLEQKWNPYFRRSVLESYLKLSAGARGAGLIVWPEAAIPAYLDEIDPAYLEALKAATAGHSDFLIGVAERERKAGSIAVYNSVISLGSNEGVYRKRHLVPFGEYLPAETLFGWLIDSLQIPMSDFSPGTGTGTTLTAAGQKIGVSICYEDAFGGELIQSLPEASLLVNVSEDAWFGDSLGPHQRLQMARMRAMETGRPMLRAANTGPSAVIDHAGVVRARSPQFKPYLLEAEVQPMHGATPYVLMGNAPLIVVLAGIVLAGMVSTRFSRRRGPGL